MNYSSRLVFPHSGSRVIQFEKELQLRRPWMAYLEITLNSLVDGKAMLSTSTSTNFKNRIILPNYFPSILNFTLHFPRTHLSGANESDDPYGLYPLHCLACRDLQRASVWEDARARSQQLNWIIKWFCPRFRSWELDTICVGSFLEFRKTPGLKPEIRVLGGLFLEFSLYFSDTFMVSSILANLEQWKLGSRVVTHLLCSRLR